MGCQLQRCFVMMMVLSCIEENVVIHSGQVNYCIVTRVVRLLLVDGFCFLVMSKLCCASSRNPQVSGVLFFVFSDVYWYGGNAK